MLTFLILLGVLQLSQAHVTYLLEKPDWVPDENHPKPDTELLSCLNLSDALPIPVKLDFLKGALCAVLSFRDITGIHDKFDPRRRMYCVLKNMFRLISLMCGQQEDANHLRMHFKILDKTNL